ncbi:MAG: elongation factor 1-beta [Halobacteriota archaeon]
MDSEGHNVGEVAVQIKIMPGTPEVDLKKLSGRIESAVSSDGRIYACEVQPIAFGLKALLITFIVEDKEGGSEALEKAISSLDDVESIQVVAVSRML